MKKVKRNKKTKKIKRWCRRRHQKGKKETGNRNNILKTDKQTGLSVWRCFERAAEGIPEPSTALASPHAASHRLRHASNTSWTTLRWVRIFTFVDWCFFFFLWSCNILVTIGVHSFNISYFFNISFVLFSLFTSCVCVCVCVCVCKNNNNRFIERKWAALRLKIHKSYKQE